ncbi:MAG: C25 family cysteine peptidase, partial [Candidatus Electryoneaceae bacterium]|nr:C25 family cysteine peptidase [Candidatus Electryoneaceae bacterium]
MIEDMVVNPEDIRRDQDEGRGAYIYIVPDYEEEEEGSVADIIAPLAQWRKKQGYPTEIIVVAENANNVDVKREILTAYQEWEIPPEFVVLVGDADRANADFMIRTWDVGRAYMWETDYRYAMLAGDDLLPELAISRISARNLDELNSIVQEKILPYESDPHIENDNGEPEVEWFRRAALMANDQRTGHSSLYLQRWARALLLEVGFNEVDTLFFTDPGGHNQRREHDFIRDNINNEGISVFIYRGWGEFNGAWGVNDVRELRNGSRLPLMIMPTCNTGDFADHVMNTHGYTEDFLWGNQGGAIGAIGSSGFTHTNYNNVLTGGLVNGLYRDDNWHLGWALNQSKIELYRHFGMYGDVDDPQVPSLKVWEAHCYQYNLIGDAGTEIWTDVPQIIEVEHPELLSVGENQMSLYITDEENDDPISGATVTLLMDGDLIRLAQTSETGRVHFTFEQGELEAETILELTVTKHNVKPYLTEIEVIEENVFVGVQSFIVDDDNAGRSHGNSDHIPNPGERIELRTFIANFGDEAMNEEITVILDGILGNIEIIEERVVVDAPAMGDSVLATFLIDINMASYNDQRLLFRVTAEEWESSIELFVAAPNLEYAEHVFTPANFNLGDTAWVDVTLRNIGAMPSPQMSAQLISGRLEVNLFNDHADFDPVDIEDDEATARFRIHAHDLTVPGTEVEMTLLLESEDGFCDTTSFSFTVGAPESDTPFGPDAYGYVCFDDTDSDWPEVAPSYEWIEIDPQLDGPGTDTEIQDRGNEQDFTVLMPLPFDFRYYGEDFEQISVCSNGWLSFGDQSKLADFQNRRIPPALGPRAQVCVFWDDLVNYVEDNEQIGGIYTWYDEENHRFIIEWSRMRRYVGMLDAQRIRPGSINTFQAILYDPQHHPTYTGDGDIVFQYETMNNDRDVDPAEFDTPYATVGIINLNATDGMEYTFWNEYPAGAAILEDERAIKFSTKLIIVVGAVEGSVIDAETLNPIEGAEVRGSRGSYALTNEDGDYMMENVLIGEDYDFTAWAPGYNEFVLEDFDVEADDTLALDFALTHPEFNLELDTLHQNLGTGLDARREVLLSNDGNGPLTYRSFFDYIDEEDGERWERLLNVNVTEVTNDTRIWGATFFNGYFWVSGSNNVRNPNYFYLFHRDGRLYRAIEQPGGSSYGFRGMTVDPERGLLYGCEGNWIVGVDYIGGSAVPQDSIPKPPGLKTALAYDSENDHFWIADIRSQLTEIDRDGQIISVYGDHELNIMGLAYFADDPDGYPVYILSQDKTNPALQVPYALVSRYNPETGDQQVVT